MERPEKGSYPNQPASPGHDWLRTARRMERLSDRPLLGDDRTMSMRRSLLSIVLKLSLPIWRFGKGKGRGWRWVMGLVLVSLLSPTGRSEALIFTPTIAPQAGDEPQAVAVGDFNRDRRQDLAIADAPSGDILVLEGNGNGTFQSPVRYAVGDTPMAITAADMDGDGWLDLIVANSESNTLSILRGLDDGTFSSPGTYTTGNGPTALTVEDFNRDGSLDVAILNTGRFGRTPPFSLEIRLNDGSGGLGPPVRYEDQESRGLFPTALAGDDLTGDGVPDLAVAWSQREWRTRNGMISLLVNSGDGTFRHRDSMNAGFTLSAIATGDLNEDGKIDLVATSLFTDTVIVLRNKGEGHFDAVDEYAVGFSPISLVVKDFNNDSYSDVAVANRASDSVFVLLGSLSGKLDAAGHFDAGSVPSGMAGGDFDGDGRPDLAVTNSRSHDISILLTGGGKIPTMSVTPARLEFRETDHSGGTQRSGIVTLSNIGLESLQIRAITLSGSNPDAFSITANSCHHILDPGSHCTLTVAFNPPERGRHEATLTITDTAYGSPRAIPLQGVVTDGNDP